MLRHWKRSGQFAVLAALSGLLASVSTQAEEGSSVLVETTAKSAVDAPELAPPANTPTLPPPKVPSTGVDANPPAPANANRPFMRPAQPKSVDAPRANLTVAAEPIPVPENSSSRLEVRPTPPIKYDTDGDARRMYRRSGELQLVMVTQNPADGCFYEIPLCIPACCTGEPTFSGGTGIFGRGVVEYCWPSCGFRAIVKFRHLLGDVRVDYEGD